MQASKHKVICTTEINRKSTKQGKYINQYLKIKTIGQGPFSKIKLYIDSSNNKKKMAIKKYNLFILKKKTRVQRGQDGQIKYSSIADDIKKQIQIMKLLDHQNVAKAYQILQDKQQQKVYIVMDYCEHKDIAHWNHKLSLFELNKIIKKQFKIIKEKFIQIAKGIQYLHSLNIVHRDIKPLNILLNSQIKVKIIDFGRSILLKNQGKQKLKGSQGTYHFMAPEMLSQKYPQGYDGKKCDIWALGVSFYGILFKKLPFYSEPLIKLFEQIENVKYEIPNDNQCEQYQIPFKKIIKKMLQIDPQKRLSAQQLIKELIQLQINQ